VKRWLVVLRVVSILSLSPISLLLAQHASARVLVSIYDTAGRAVTGATLLVVGEPGETNADSLGHAEVTLRPGTWVIRTARIGYAMQERTVSLGPGTLHQIAFRLVDVGCVLQEVSVPSRPSPASDAGARALRGC
jgi:hypothetical protein